MDHELIILSYTTKLLYQHWNCLGLYCLFRKLSLFKLIFSLLFYSWWFLALNITYNSEFMLLFIAFFFSLFFFFFNALFIWAFFFYFLYITLDYIIVFSSVFLAYNYVHYFKIFFFEDFFYLIFQQTFFIEISKQLNWSQMKTFYLGVVWVFFYELVIS